MRAPRPGLAIGVTVLASIICMMCLMRGVSMVQRDILQKEQKHILVKNYLEHTREARNEVIRSENLPWDVCQALTYVIHRIELTDMILAVQLFACCL